MMVKPPPRRIASTCPPWPLRKAGDCQIVDVMSDVTDFRDTAERLGSLDALAGVETAVTHLAGAMDLPQFVLLCTRQTGGRCCRARTHPGTSLCGYSGAPHPRGN